MNKKTVKIITCVLAALLLIGFVCTTVHADEINPKDISIDFGDSQGSEDMMNIAGKVMGLIRNVAVVGGVILLMVLGVKYMMGSVEEKADYKKSLVPLIVGIVVVMVASTIISFVINFF